MSQRKVGMLFISALILSLAIVGVFLRQGDTSKPTERPNQATLQSDEAAQTVRETSQVVPSSSHYSAASKFNDDASEVESITEEYESVSDHPSPSEKQVSDSLLAEEDASSGHDGLFDSQPLIPSNDISDSTSIPGGASAMVTIGGVEYTVRPGEPLEIVTYSPGTMNPREMPPEERRRYGQLHEELAVTECGSPREREIIAELHRIDAATSRPRPRKHRVSLTYTFTPASTNE